MRLRNDKSIYIVYISRKFTNIENITYMDCGMIKMPSQRQTFPLAKRSLIWMVDRRVWDVATWFLVQWLVRLLQIKIPACDLQYKMEDHPNHISFVEDRHNCAKEKRKGEFSIESILLAKSTTSKYVDSYKIEVV